jgi:hypothetical protein
MSPTMRAKLSTIGDRKDQSSLLDLVPVAVDEPLISFVGMSLTGPVHEQLPHLVVATAYGKKRTQVIQKI